LTVSTRKGGIDSQGFRGARCWSFPKLSFFFRSAIDFVSAELQFPCLNVIVPELAGKTRIKTRKRFVVKRKKEHE